MKNNNFKNNPLWKFIDTFVTPFVKGICAVIGGIAIIFAYVLKAVIYIFIYVALGGFLFGNRR